MPSGLPRQPLRLAQRAPPPAATPLFSPGQPRCRRQHRQRHFLRNHQPRHHQPDGYGFDNGSRWRDCAGHAVPDRAVSHAAVTVNGPNALGTFTLQNVPAGTYDLFPLTEPTSTALAALRSRASSGTALGGITSTINPNAAPTGSALNSFVLGGDSTSNYTGSGQAGRQRHRLAEPGAQSVIPSAALAAVKATSTWLQLVLVPEPLRDGLDRFGPGRYHLLPPAPQVVSFSVQARPFESHVFSGRDIALRCPRPRTCGRNERERPYDSANSLRRCTRRRTAQRAIPTTLNT